MSWIPLHNQFRILVYSKILTSSEPTGFLLNCIQRPTGFLSIKLAEWPVGYDDETLAYRSKVAITTFHLVSLDF